MTRTKLMILATVLLTAGSVMEARAQFIPPCLPAIDNNSLTASPIYSGVSKNGAWVRWYCYDDATLTVTKVQYVGTLAELSKVGGRVATIIKAADPLRSLQTAGNRFPILPLTDPSLAAIVADMNAVK